MNKQKCNSKVEKPCNDKTLLKYFFELYLENKPLKPNSKSKYRTAWRRIEDWLGVKKAAKIKLKDIDLKWIEDFDKFISGNAPKPNGRRLHHAAVKAVLNYAKAYQCIPFNPYDCFKIRKNKTAKRSMDVRALRRIIFADNLKPWMIPHRDFFVLSFMLRGLNTVDICNLPKPINSRIEWQRSKTGQPMSLKIEPEIQEIIDRYAGKDLLVKFAEGRYYRNYNLKLNHAMHEICKHLNDTRKDDEVIVPDFTMYWARCTWSTIAHKLGIGLEIICVALAQSTRTMTEHYITIDDEVIDDANRRVLDYVLYDDKKNTMPRLSTIEGQSPLINNAVHDMSIKGRINNLLGISFDVDLRIKIG